MSNRLFASLMLALGLVLSANVAEAGEGNLLEPDIRRGIQVPFVENQGTDPPFIRFRAETFVGTAVVTAEGSLRLAVPSAAGGDECVVIEQSWLGRRPSRPEGLVRSETVVRTTVGSDPGLWQQAASSFDVVSLGQVYDGIEVRVRAHGNTVEQLYYVAPGADPLWIRSRIDGVDAVSIDARGQLVLDTGVGVVTYSAPEAYQEIAGARHPVDVAYELTEDGYRFALGSYDPSFELVIDPLLQATYAGGTGSERVNLLFVHPDNGDVYIAGETTSTEFGIDEQALAHVQGFIARLDPDLEQIRFVQYLGGLGTERVTHVAIHPPGSPRAGEMVFMGPTTSDNWPAEGYGTPGNDSLFVGIFDEALQTDVIRWISGSFNDDPTSIAIHPTSYAVYIAGSTGSEDFLATEDVRWTDGGIQETKAGIIDAFVARLAPNLAAVEQATYLGGYSGSEVEVTLAIDATRGIYVQGRTNSGNRGAIDDDNWPTEIMAALDPPVDTPQPEFGGGIEDLFVGLISPDLDVPYMLTYLGGDGIEETKVPRIVIHPETGDVYIAGETASTDADPGQGIQWSPGVFLARYSPMMDELEAFATLTASSVDDILYHASGDLFVLGTAADTLPEDETNGSLQPAYGGGASDGFVARYDADLGLERATYLGGSDREGGQAFVEHPESGVLYVTGYTYSNDYPRTAGGAIARYRGFQEGFVARVEANLVDATQSQSTYYGGSVNDWPNVLTIVADPGDVYIAGSTTSSDLPRTDGGAQPDSIRDPEAFVALFDDTLASGSAPEIEVVPPSYDFGTFDVGARSGPVEFTIRNVGTDDLIISTISNSDATNFIVVTNGGSNGCSPARPFTLGPDESCTFTVELAPSVVGELSATVTIESNDLDEGTLRVPLTGVGASGNGGPGDDSGGCGCAVPGQLLGPSPASVALALGLVFLLWRRRRKRRHSPQSVSGE